MAGRKHHHVPQLLQRRFGTKGAKSTTVVVYSAGKEPFPVNTSKFGAERDFYADGDNFFVDDLITEFENDIQSFVIRLVEGDSEALADRLTISALITHLELRSSFLRNQLFEISGMMGDYIENIFGNRKNLIRTLQQYCRENPNFVRDAILEKFGEDAPIDALESILVPKIEPFLNELSDEIVERFADMLLGMREALSSAVKPAHLEALKSHPSDIERAKFYSGLNYSIQKAPVGSFILPDTMIAFCMKNRVSPFTQAGDTLDQLILPLAPDTILIGDRKKTVHRQISETNNMLASISLRSFIAIDDRADFRRLVRKIGRNAKIFSAADSQILFRGLLNQRTGERRSRMNSK